MNRERLAYLLEKYEQGRCTVAEQAELSDFYDSLGEDDDELPAHIRININEYVAERYRKLKAIIDSQHQKKPKKENRFLYRSIAAMLIVSAIGVILYLVIGKSSHVNKLPAVVSYDLKNNQVTDSRFFMLPDSSIVILHAGSSLKVDTTQFNVASRNVNLVGEAYFDIHHNKHKPFVITAGLLKITVLGTAFNIKERGDSVVVTVTRGKVRVEKANKEIAVLTANQEVVYAKSQAVQRNAETIKSPDWVTVGLQFNGETFKEIANKLQERYSVAINLGGNMSNCKITITDAFAGTESIDEILSFICPIVNATYTKYEAGYSITGRGCN